LLYMHPYTRGLLKEVPSLDKRSVEFAAIKGEIASALNPPAGCHFHPRCPFSEAICQREQPDLYNAGIGHFVACHKL